MKKIVLLALGLLVSTGCSVTIRNITAQSWDGDGKGVYVGYWEGVCKPIVGCGTGDGRIKWCKIDETNHLICEEQMEVFNLLQAKEIK